MFQKTGRNRGKNTKPVSFIARELTATDDEGITSVAQFGVGFETKLAAQVHQVGNNELQVRGSDRLEIDVLLDRLRSLPAKFDLIDKKNSRLYLCTPITSGPQGYLAGDAEQRQRPPRDGVWLEVMPRGNSISQAFAVLGGKGQINCHAPSIADALQFLSKAKGIKPEISSQFGEARLIDKPSVMIGMSIDINAYYRVIAKIGMNMIAFVEGLEVARSEYFKKARNYIRYGEGDLGIFPMPDAEMPPGVKLWLAKRHYLLITYIKIDDEYSVCFIPYFYGVGSGVIVLARSGTCPLQRPFTLLVDFAENRILRM